MLYYFEPHVCAANQAVRAPKSKWITQTRRETSLRPAQRDHRKVFLKTMYAIIETGGKQYRVTEGDEIFVEKLGKYDGEQVTFDKVLVVEGDKLIAGTPFVNGAAVVGTVIKSGKAKKITVFTYKAKKNVHRKLGHRQPYTKVKIDSITL